MTVSRHRQRGFLLNPYRFDGGGPGPDPGSDPYFSDVSLLLHMDGADGGTSFPDSSSSSRTVVNHGVTTTTAEKKFGVSSAQINSGTYLEVADTAETNFGSIPFTVEWWARPTQFNGDAGMVSRRVSAVYCPWEIRLSSVGVNTLVANPSNSNWLHIAAFSGTAVSLNVWTHFAFVGDGSSLKMFVGGIQSSTVLAYTMLASDPTGLFIGRGGDNGFVGQMDDVRITPGVARYAADFSPPTAPFPDHA